VVDRVVRYGVANALKAAVKELIAAGTVETAARIFHQLPSLMTFWRVS
jgi:hypothetical protein